MPTLSFAADRCRLADCWMVMAVRRATIAKRLQSGNCQPEATGTFTQYVLGITHNISITYTCRTTSKSGLVGERQAAKLLVGSYTQLKMLDQVRSHFVRVAAARRCCPADTVKRKVALRRQLRQQHRRIRSPQSSGSSESDIGCVGKGSRNALCC